MPASSSPSTPGSTSRTPAAPCTTTALLCRNVALVDEHTLGDLPQHQPTSLSSRIA